MKKVVGLQQELRIKYLRETMERRMITIGVYRNKPGNGGKLKYT